MEERKCLYCGEPIIGRVDKKFCCDSCRNSYNYEKTHKQVNVVRKINGILARNHNILEEMNPNGKFRLRPRLRAKGDRQGCLRLGEKQRLKTKQYNTIQKL